MTALDDWPLVADYSSIVVFADLVGMVLFDWVALDIDQHFEVCILEIASVSGTAVSRNVEHYLQMVDNWIQTDLDYSVDGNSRPVRNVQTSYKLCSMFELFDSLVLYRKKSIVVALPTSDSATDSLGDLYLHP